MGISPMYVGQISPIWTPNITVDSGAVAPLIGVNAATFVLYIYNLQTQQTRVGNGTFTITNASTGSITYAWDLTDTAVMGRYTLQVSYIDANGKNVDCDPVPWTVRARGSLVDPL